MKTLITTIKTTAWMLLCTLCIMSCTQEEIVSGGEKDYAGKPIQIIVSGPDNHAVSRAATSAKEFFQTGDIIHVSTTFTYINGHQGNDPKVVYACLKYDGKKWNEVTSPKTFTWPWNAESASFTAYYLPATPTAPNKDPMNYGDVKINISELNKPKTEKETWTDPLYASYTDIAAGSSVYLQFNHLLTKVTFTNLDKATAGEELRLIADCGDQMIFTRIGTKPDSGNTDELKYTFNKTAEYITGQCVDTGNTPPTIEASFLLPPLTAKSAIKLAYKDMSPYHSLELPEVLLPKGLEAGKHYTIDVTKLADNFISDAVKEEDWNKNTAVDLSKEDVKKYLESIRDGEPCAVKINGTNVQILTTYEEKIDGKIKNVVAQIKDVNFPTVEGEVFTPVNLRQNIIFQGNGHKITNLKITNTIQDDANPGVTNPRGAICKALFGKNAGTIKNLIIETASIEAGTGKDERYAAILAGENEGTIENVTIKNVTIKGSSAVAIGCLVGSNSLNIHNCHITGNVKITIDQTDTYGNEQCYIGGLIGFASGESKIIDCSINAATEKQITIKGSYQSLFAGGMIGSLENQTEACSTNLNISIDQNVTLQKLYVGGFAGQLSGTTNKSTAIGNVTIPESLTGNLIVGGFAGELYNGSLNDCATSGNLTCASTLVTAGGLVGQMSVRPENTTIQFSSATGTTPTGIGGLVGTIQSGKGTLTISNCFCINQATAFIATEGASPTDCHQNGIKVGTEESFTPSTPHMEQWTNTPAIYGKDEKGQTIYYLKRKL